MQSFLLILEKQSLQLIVIILSSWLSCLNDFTLKLTNNNLMPNNHAEDPELNKEYLKCKKNHDAILEK
jgi:hypothetical protein